MIEEVWREEDAIDLCVHFVKVVASCYALWFLIKAYIVHFTQFETIA